MDLNDVIKSAYSIIPNRIQHQIRRAIDPEFRSRQDELRRLRELPRRTETTTDLLGATTHLIDAASFLSAYRSIFEQEIYAFDPQYGSPKILDGGANIGLAVLYWKQNIPEADIIAFEPDPDIFDVLERNVRQHGYDEDVVLVQKGLWSKSGAVAFQSDGADAGQLVETENVKTTGRQVPVACLTPYLDERVDMLKLDIEGAEVEVLNDVAEHLGSVQNLFVEYHSYVGEEQRIDEVLGILRDAGFRIHIKPELVADQPFLQRLNSYGMDHRLNIFAYRD